MCLKDVLEEFILELEMQNYSPRTIKAYRNNNLLMFTFIENEFGVTELEGIQTVYIKDYIKFLQKNKRKVSYINGIIKSFRAFFKYAVNEEYIENNPVL
ncbi:phage integrase SAM-like domain-containing protein [Clostridium sardiniense]|uniref:phage integrase SAM-like domain-containing protein n=1 Tax=Clostridium sardiniense TaxID=29369 RepID=UPI001FD1A772|nr:phage integrase SAM-like domain-containing protein [Clostridium sardiniense]MDQ0459002.1 site-specific recombinase XerD [Clostridium sardiniense]